MKMFYRGIYDKGGTFMQSEKIIRMLIIFVLTLVFTGCQSGSVTS